MNTKTFTFISTKFIIYFQPTILIDLIYYKRFFFLISAFKLVRGQDFGYEGSKGKSVSSFPYIKFHKNEFND